MRLTERQARELLATVPVARLATVNPIGRPHVVPITFAVDGDVVYTAIDAKPKTTRNLQRLRNLRANPAAAVLADHYEDDWSRLWWVRADGDATLLGETGVLSAPIRLLAERYPQYRDRPPDGPVVAIRVDRWTGWSAARFWD